MSQLNDYLYIVNFRQRAASSFSTISVRCIREGIAISFAGVLPRYLFCFSFSQHLNKHVHSVLYCSECYCILIECFSKQQWQHAVNFNWT